LKPGTGIFGSVIRPLRLIGLKIYSANNGVGIRIKITVDPETEKPTEISWYLNGKLAESAPVTCTLEVVDQQIAEDPAWANAEYRHNSDIWKRP
jgi:hypothetical protein